MLVSKIVKFQILVHLQYSPTFLVKPRLNSLLKNKIMFNCGYLFLCIDKQFILNERQVQKIQYFNHPYFFSCVAPLMCTHKRLVVGYS